MKALSVRPEPAFLILCGDKTVECRSWKTDYRGDILICSTQNIVYDTIPGHALCVARLVDVVPFKREHCEKAYMPRSAFKPGLFAWLLDDIRAIEPVPVKGKLSLWEYSPAVKIVGRINADDDNDPIWIKYYEPLVV